MSENENPGHVESVVQRTTAPALVVGDLEFDVRVVGKELVATDVVALTLRAPDGARLPRWEPGAHVDLLVGLAPVRQYSLCGDPADPHEWRIAVLREADGRGTSRFVHDELAEGDVLRLRGPRNNFALVEAPRYLFVAGGIGITPLLPMIDAAERRGTPWRLVYGGRRRASMAFLHELERRGERVAIVAQDEAGHPDLARALDESPPDTAVYCCGPEPLLAAIEQCCTTRPTGALHVERFAARPMDSAVPNTCFEVILARSGLTLTVPSDRSVLDVVEEAGVEVSSSCSEGTCGTCETPVVNGAPEHRDAVLDDRERQRNDSMMICVSRSRDPRLVLDL